MNPLPIILLSIGVIVNALHINKVKNNPLIVHETHCYKQTIENDRAILHRIKCSEGK